MTQKPSAPTSLQAQPEPLAQAAQPPSGRPLGETAAAGRQSNPPGTPSTRRAAPADPLTWRVKRRADEAADPEPAGSKPIETGAVDADTAAQSTPTDLVTLPALDAGATHEIPVGQLPDLGGPTAQGHEGWRSDTLLAQADVSKLPAPGIGAQTGTAAPGSGTAAASGMTVAQVAGLIMAGGLTGMAALAAKTKDSTPPKVDTVSDGTPAQVSNQDVVFVVTFSEAIVGPVGVANFAASNGTVTAVSQVGTTNAYSVTVAPTPNTASAEISLRLVATGLRDAAGNRVLDADLAPLGRQNIDTLAPSLVINSDKALLGEQEVAQITFTFSEDPGASFAATDVVVTGGTLGQVTGSGLTRTATFTPTTDLTGVSATLAVASASYSDAVGNAGGAATTLSIALETRTPTSLVIQDGYLDGADVWVDMNDSGTIDAGDYLVGQSVEGQVNGFLTAAQKAHNLIAQGGTDISTGLPFEGSYSATPGSTVVNPLTTLVQSIVKTELGDTSQLSPQEALERLAQAKASAMAKVSEALDLPPGVDLTRIDTIATASAAQGDAASGISLTQALEINSKALMVANVMAVGAAALKGAGNSSSADTPTLSSLSDFIVGGIVKAMDSALASGSALAMDDSAALSAILTSAAQTATDSDPTRYSMDEAKLSNASAAVGTAVASTNSLIDTLTGNAKSAVATNAQAAEDTLLRILAAQKAAMNQIQDIKTGDSAKLLDLANDFSDAAAVQLQSQSVGPLRLGTAVAVDAPAQAAADSAAPQVVSVSVKAERAGELAQFVVLMSEGVLIEATATSRPSLAIQTTVGGAPSLALLDTSRSGGDKLVFTYRVAPGDSQLAVVDGSINLPQGSSIKDLAGNLAQLDLASGLSGFVAPPIDGVAPTITVSAREAFVPAGQSTLLTFSVSEAVAFSELSNAVHADAFGADDITVREAGQVVRGRISQFTALGEREGRHLYQALLTPGDANAATEVAVGAGRFTDNAGNPNLESNLVAVARQSLEPSIVVTADQSTFNAQDAGDASVSTMLRFTLSQDSSNFTADDVTVSGPGSLSNFSGSGLQYSAVLTGMDSSTQVQVAAGRFSGEGATNLASNTKGFSVDTRAPSVVSVSDSTTATVTRQDIAFRVDFDEAVSGTVSTNSFSASLASVLSVSRLTGSNSYTVVVRPTANAEGTVGLSLRATGLADAAGNPVADANLASKGGQAIDTLAPALAISSDKAAVKIGERATVTFAFSEAPTGFADSDVTTTGGTLSTPTASSLDPKVYTATFTPTAGLASGSASITVAAGSYLDAAGNAGGAGTTPAINIDTVAPTVTSVTEATTAEITKDPISFTVSFSEALTGTVGTDSFAATNGTVTSVSQVGTSNAYTVVVTPTAGVASGTVALSLVGAGLSDAAGNALANASLTGLASQAVDTLAPNAPALVLDNGEVKVTAETGANTVVTFSRSDGGTLSKAVTGNGSTPVTVVLDAADLTALGKGTIGASAVATDSVGNASSVGTASFTFDSAAPTVSTVTEATTAAITKDPISFTVTFSEALTGTVGTDSFTATNGTVTSVTAGANNAYTVVVTPTAGVASGSVALSLVGAGLADAAGNAVDSASLANFASQSIDTVAPTVTSVTEATSAEITKDPVSFTVTFSEALNGTVGTSSFTATNGSVTSVSQVGTSNAYAVVVTPTAGSASGTVALSLLGTGLADAAGNAVDSASLANFASQSIDTLAPTLAISSDKAAVKSGESATVTFAFSEAPNGFAASDVTTTGGTLSTPTASSLDPKVYTATFTPTAGLASGSASITVAAGSYLDAAGNAGGAGTTPAINIDTVAPTVTSITEATTAEITKDPISFTVSFSEALTGTVGTDSFAATNGTVTSVSQVGTSDTYTVVVTPTAGLDSGTVALSLVGAGLADAAGNTLGSASLTNFASQSVDTLAPNAPNLTLGIGVANGATLAEATAAGGVVTVSAESGASTVVTFSRSGGGTVSKTVTGNGSTPVAVTLTSTELGTLGNGTINVSAVATDAAGNATNSTATTSFAVDSTPPTFGVSQAVISTSFEESHLISALKLDIPNPSVATATLDTTNDELDFSASGDTNMWSSRQDVPIAYVMSPQVGLNQSWSVETKLRINDVGASRQVAGLTFYSDADGAKPTFTFGLEGWNAGGSTPSYSGLFIALEALGSGRIREADSYSADNVYLKVEVTEKGSSDDYRFFYKQNSSDPWTQHGGSAYVLSSSADNARTGLWYKTEAAKPGAAFDELKLVSGDGPAWTVVTSTMAGSAGNSTGETIALTLTFDDNVSGLTSGSNDTIFTVDGSGVSATWAGVDGTNTRTLTYTVASNQNGQAAIDEAALKATLSNGIFDAAGNAFAYNANGGNIANIDSTALPVVDTSEPIAPSLTLGTGVADGATLAEATTALVTFTAESGAITAVTFSRTGGGTVSKNFTGNGSTPVTVSLTSAELTALGNGTINVSAVATDAAGNASSAGSGSFLLDTAAPALSSTAPATVLGAALAGTAGNSTGETITLTLTFDGNVNGLTSGSNSTIFTVGGSGVSAAWAGTNGTNTRTLTYTVASNQNGQAAINEAALQAALIAGVTDAAGNAFAGSTGIALSSMTSDIPNSNVGSITYDATSGKLNFGASGNTDMWGSRDNALIAYVPSPQVALNETWSVETRLEINDRAQSGQNAGLTFYSQAGARPDFTFGLTGWDGNWRINVEDFSAGQWSGGVAVYSGSSVYLRASVTEKGASDEYQFFYKANSADAWTQLGSVNFVPVNPVQGNALTGIFYKTADARPGVSVLELSTSGGNSANIPNIDGTALPVVDTQAPTATLTAGTGTNTSNATVQSSEVGTAYLVKTGGASPVTITSLASITGADGAKWNSVATSTASTATNLSLTGLEDGIYSLYSVDAAGNLSVAASNTYTVDSTAPSLIVSPAAGSQAVIDLGGAYGKLIAPIQAGGNWFYYWDRDGNGAANVEELYIEGAKHNFLDTFFRYDSSLNATNPTNDTSDVYRFATLDGLTLALPSVQELQAIRAQANGLPTGWLSDPWGSYYWTATPGSSTDTHAAYSPLTDGLIADASDSFMMGIALRVISSAKPGIGLTQLTGAAGNGAGETIALTLTFDGNVSGLSTGINNTIFTVGGLGVDANWSGTGSTRTLTYTIAPGQNGQTAINETALKDALIAGVTDAAGNAFAYSANGGNIPNIDSTALPVVDTQAPTTSIASAALSVDSGTNGNDFITNTASQTISGNLSANLAAGETVLVSLNNGANWLAASGSVGSNAWSLASQTLSGSNTLKVKVTDEAGNDGAVFSQAYTITPNQAPVNQLPLAQLPAGLSWTTVGAYSVYSFTQVGTSTFNLASALNVEALVVAGGAAGAWSSNLATGGGGGGGVAHVPALPLSSGTYTVTVGSGGIAAPGATNYGDATYNGGNSSIVGSNVSVTVYGGGGGGGYGGDNGIAGGSGGGGHWSTGQGGAVTPGIATGIANVSFYGNAGGQSDRQYTAGGGGGGATSAGQNATPGAGGAGGQGLTSSITGTAVVYGSGGGGAGNNASGLGGTNGGHAATVGSPATSGVANTGGGGGAGGDGSSGRQNNGSGGSGIVVLRALTGIQVAADTPQAITGLQISDPDQTGVFTVSLTQTQGVLTVDQNVPSGLTAAGITGNETASVTLTGTLAQINATLAAVKGLVLRANAGYTGAAQLTMVTSDSQGAADTDVIAIHVTADVTAPTLSSAAPTTALGTALTGTAGNSAGETITLTLTFDGNVIGLSSGSNSTIFTVSGTGVPATWSGSGSTRTLTYTIAAGQNGQAAIDEAALKTALIAGLTDAAGNAFAYSVSIPNIDVSPLPVVDTTGPTLTNPVLARYIRVYHNASASRQDILSLTGLRAMVGEVDVAANLLATASTHITAGTDSGTLNTVAFAPAALVDSTVGNAFTGQSGTASGLAYVTTTESATAVTSNKVFIDVDLGAVYKIDDLLLWGRNNPDTAGQSDNLRVFMGTTAPGSQTYTQLSASTAFVDVGTVAATPGGAGTTIAINSLETSPTLTNSGAQPGNSLLVTTSTLAGSAGNSAGETITLTLDFDGAVSGLSSGTNSTIFTVGGSGVSATWSGSGSTRTLTYTIASGQNGQAAIDEQALKAALIAGITDAAGNAFAYAGNIAGIDDGAINTPIQFGLNTSGGVDGFQSVYLIPSDGFASAVGQEVHSWSFASGNFGGSRNITPLLFEKVGNDYVLRAIGSTQQAQGSTVYQDLAFNTVAGNTTIANANYLFGWKDGTQTVDNEGVIAILGGSPGSWTSQYFNGQDITAQTIGSAVAFREVFADRNYQFNVKTRESVLPVVDGTAPTLSSTAPTTALGAALAGTAGNSAGEAITLTLTFDGNVNGLTSGSNSTIFTLAGSGVSATWAGTNGTNSRTLTYMIKAGQNGQAAINEAALKTALIAGITDTAGNAFAYTANSGNIPDIDSTALPVVDTKFDAAKDFIAGPTAQSANNIWQYFSADFASNNISNLQHLTDWDTDGNGLLLLAQWDANGTSGDYPFVQKQSNGSLIIHPEQNAGKAVVVAWKNTSASSVVVDVDAALGLVGKSLNDFGSVGGQQTASSDGITYLVTTSASISSTPVVLSQGALDESGSTAAPSSTTLNLDGLTLAPGAMVSVAVHGNAAYFWDHTLLDLTVSPIASVIDLGSLGQLIAPVQVEGKWYYHLDRNGDGTTAGDAYYRDTGTYRLSEIYDLFKQDVNGVAGSSTTDTYRYATVNGVKLALPTLGTSPDARLMDGTALNNATETNPSYDDLSAIWDAYNGTLVGSYTGQGLNGSNRGSGNITSGAPGAWVNDSYVSATPWPSSDDHAALRVYDGLVFNHENWAMNVALQVL